VTYALCVAGSDATSGIGPAPRSNVLATTGGPGIVSADAVPPARLRPDAAMQRKTTALTMKPPFDEHPVGVSVPAQRLSIGIYPQSPANLHTASKRRFASSQHHESVIQARASARTNKDFS
jgi:hypothetical protein